MPIEHADLFAALAAPFDPSEVKIRSQSGRQLHYITARTAMNRLDDVLGPARWWDEYIPGENSVLCRLTIVLPDGKTLTKCDAGGYAGMADSGDDDKSGYSDSFKRACVKFGVGRYLYRDGVPMFVQERLGAGADPGEIPNEPAHRDREPDRASQGHGKERNKWGGAKPQGEPAGRGGGNESGNGRGHDGPPRSGRALFAWTKEQEQRYSVGLLKYINGWAKLQEFPGRMVEWDAEQVALAYAESCRKLQAVQSGDEPARYDEAMSN